MTAKDIRILDNWVDSFLKYMVALPSPEIYNRWTAYNILAGALERRVWTDISGRNLYPNMITILVGPPGTGKTTATEQARAFWTATRILNVAPRNVTRESFMKELGLLPKTFLNKEEYQVYNPLLVVLDELATLLPEYILEFLNVMNDLYDCPEYFKYTIKENQLHCQRPHLNLITTITPPGLVEDLLPEEAFGFGFIPRSVMVYSEYHTKLSISSPIGDRERLKIQLINDLMSIGNVTGEFTWTSEAQEFINEWNKGGTQNDAPTHTKLQGYNTRRVIHCIKLAMVLSVSRSKSGEITLRDVEAAITALIEVENEMPKIFAE